MKSPQPTTGNLKAQNFPPNFRSFSIHRAIKKQLCFNQECQTSRKKSDIPEIDHVPVIVGVRMNMIVTAVAQEISVMKRGTVQVKTSHYMFPTCQLRSPTNTTFCIFHVLQLSTFSTSHAYFVYSFPFCILSTSLQYSSPGATLNTLSTVL